MLRICITGAAGQIAYSFIPMLLSGQVIDSPIDLRLLDIPPMEGILKGVAMEIEDCNYSRLKNLSIGSDPEIAFKDADLVSINFHILVFLGGFPRKPGMERKDLLQMNGKIFKAQGEALNEVAKPEVRCLVVANPANTNCLILSRHAPNIPKTNFTCLTRLDQNRAYSYLQKTLGIQQVSDVIIWGNHSATQYPSVQYAKNCDQQVILDQDQKEIFIKVIQTRGAEVLKARNNSSVFSAANAVKDHIHDWFYGSTETQSMGVISNGEYGIPTNLCFSFPVILKGNFIYEIKLEHNPDEYSKEKIHLTLSELLEEETEAGFPREQI